MTATTKNPAKRCNADGAVNAESLQGNHTMSLPSSISAKQIHTTPVSIEAYDKVCLKLSYLRALITTISAEDFTSFDCLHKSSQHDLIWLALDLINDVEKARQQLTGSGHEQD